MISAARATSLILRLRTRRLWSGWTARWQRRRGARAGTPLKRRNGWIFPALSTLWLLGGGVALGFTLRHTLDTELYGAVARSRGEALVVALTWAYALLLTVADSELAKADWDLEFLVTLPVRIPTLLAIRLFERTLICPAGYLAVLPFLIVHQWHNNRRGWALPLAVLSLLPLNACLAAIQTVVDTGLRMRWGPARLRNLRAVGQLAGVGLLYAVVSIAQGHSFVLQLWIYLPSAIRWTPFALALTSTKMGALWLVLESLGALAISLAILSYLMRFGLVAGGERETGRRQAPTRPASNRIGALALRELRLLRRDRAFLVQTLLLPLIIVTLQTVTNKKGLHDSQLLQHPSVLAAMAFAMAAYALLFSALQTLNAEGEAIWILYTLPLPIERLLRQKALFWGRWALCYPLLFFAGYFAIGGSVTGEALAAVALTLYGVAVYTAIATALGIFAADPLTRKIERRVRPSFVYLYLMLVSLYGYAMVAATVWQTIVLVGLSGALAVSLWQKAKAGLPYLLDPVALPPATVDVADGMVAAFFFFIAQSAIYLVLRDHASMHVSIVTAYGSAGLLTYASSRAIFWRNGTSGVPSLFSRRWPRDLALGLVGGLLASAFGAAYLRTIFHFGWFKSYWSSPGFGSEDKHWFVFLAVIAAPLAEEFLFRGLIFAGMRRLWSWPVAATASAAVFAICHPPPAALPVFVLGWIAAALYRYTDRLSGSMVAHGTYNALMAWLSFSAT